LKSFPQVTQEHLSEPAAQHLHGEKERLLPATDPTCAVRADAAARHDAVEMRMKMKVLSPRVKHRQKANRSAQTLGIGCNREQSFRCGPEQDAIDLARILKCQPADLLRQRKYDMEVRDRQQFGLPLG
jgi:hypothetical protein